MKETSRCQLFSQGCGGCPFLPFPYEEQLRKKQKRVESLLARFGAVQPILGMEDPWHYRNKAISTFSATGRQLISGIYRQGTHQVIPVENCLLHHPALDQAIEAVRQVARACHYEPFHEDRRTGLLRHVLVRHSLATDQVLVALVTSTPVLPGSKAFVTQVRSLCPQISTIVQNINSRHSSAVLGPSEKALYGKGYIEDTLCGICFRLSASSFYQINPVQTEVLYRTAIQMEQLSASQTVIDAYCGVGTIGLAAASHAGCVIGVESNRQAVLCAIQNARSNQITNTRFYCEDATEFLQQQAARAAHVDVLFMDPPRAGSTPAFLDALCQIAPQKVVYISCNPETQQRDLDFLCRRGWKVLKIQPVDLFPHTEHIECCALLVPSETKRRS